MTATNKPTSPLFSSIPAADPATMPPLPADLPPNMASALMALRDALSEPALPRHLDPLLAPAPVRAAPVGRPGKIQPNQVVRLVRFVKLGYGISESARRAGLKRSTAQFVLAGRLTICHHPAVKAAGVLLPDPAAPRGAKNTPETPIHPLGAAQTDSWGVGSHTAAEAPTADPLPPAPENGEASQA